MAGKAGKAGNKYLFLTSGCTGLEFGTIFILGDFFVIFDNFPKCLGIPWGTLFGAHMGYLMGYLDFH